MGLLKEDISVWDFLKKSDKPIFLYGMGNGASKILNIFKKYEIKCSGIFASDNFVRGHFFEGFKVLKYSKVVEDFKDFIIVMAFAVKTLDMIDMVYNLSKKHILVSPDVPVAGEGVFNLDFYNKNLDEINKAYNLLFDDVSKKVFVDILNFKISGKISYLLDCQTSREEVFENILKLSNTESFIDAGAYNGDTVLEFLKFTSGEYENIIAIEPDQKNFKKLSKTIKENGISKITSFNLGIWNKKGSIGFFHESGRSSFLSNSSISKVDVDTIDNICENNSISFIKYDVEGYEKEAIEGSLNSIKRYKPKLEIAGYHRNEDIFSLPILINSIDKDYKIYLRHNPYIPAWETNFYAIRD
ncbi:MAG: FkbM family methyltransferase [Oscillospiraceae bacterium]|nr:FkbM family methyltransferase [Oscillospiraceae bacterium]